MRMRILMVVRQFYPWVGGTERQAQKLSAKLIELGVDVRVVTGWWFRGTPQREMIGPVPVFRNFTFWEMFGVSGLRKFGGYTYLLTLLWHLWRRRHDYDIIHVHLLNYHAFPAVLAGRWWGKKTIIKTANSGQGSDIRRMQSDMLPGQRWMLPVTLTAHRLVAINVESVAELREAGTSPERIITIPNGVEVSGPSKRDYALNGNVTAMFVGRLHSNKGLDVLLTAFQQVIRRRPDQGWRLWLVGDGPLRSQLEAQAADLGLAERMKFWGWVENVSSLLAQADVFVLPSRTEGISNALLEAMAVGLPCVATSIGGNVDLLQTHQAGLLVPPDDVNALAEALLSLGGTEALRAQLGRRARQMVEAHFSIDSVAQQYLELYHSLMHQ